MSDADDWRNAVLLALAESVGMSVPSVERWLNGATQPHPAMRPTILARLAHREASPRPCEDAEQTEAVKQAALDVALAGIVWLEARNEAKKPHAMTRVWQAHRDAEAALIRALRALPGGPNPPPAALQGPWRTSCTEDDPCPCCKWDRPMAAPGSSAAEGTPLDVWIAFTDQNIHAFRTKLEGERFVARGVAEWTLAGPYNPGEAMPSEGAGDG